jgi:hypothetical protein
MMNFMTRRRPPSLTLPPEGRGDSGFITCAMQFPSPFRGRVREGDVWHRPLVSHG